MSVYPIILSQTKFTHRDKLRYPFEERGLQFGDGVYEVIRIYKGSYYLLHEHVNRLFRSAEAIKLVLPFSKEEITNLLLDLLQRNDMTADGKVYLQSTRGSAPREHTFPEDVEANVYAYVQDLPRNHKNLENGVNVITRHDSRWDYCYIKSLNLLPNVLAKQEAKENGCFEAIFHKDGLVTECSSSNAYLVKDGKIYTHPASSSILHGCVRMRVEQFASDLSLPFIENGFSLDDIKDADEMFLSSSTAEVTPIVSVDGAKVGNGTPGKHTRKLQEAYEKDANIIKHTV
ncbi:D-amino-acid transaminase [Virgibacillus siamensis]|uniref:D-alanine aminotransferase n=1 Tax=Virgibacillus siamensis TaxID=480071 RepID=A0ABN1FQC8_9BACI